MQPSGKFGAFLEEVKKETTALTHTDLRFLPRPLVMGQQVDDARDSYENQGDISFPKNGYETHTHTHSVS